MHWLLRLYPSAWRRRYGEEVSQMLGDRPLRPQQVVDIAFGAVDAWLSPAVRRASRDQRQSGQEGADMLANWKLICAGTRTKVTTRDALVSAGVLITCTLVLLAAGALADLQGHAGLGDALKALAFPLSVTAALPFGTMKGQPVRAQTAILGATLALLLFATWLAARI